MASAWNMPFLQDKQSQSYFYALVDGALVEGFYNNLSQINKLRYKSLLSGTTDAASASVGPILLELIPDIHSAVIDELLVIQTQCPTPVWLTAELNFVRLFNTLRDLLYVERENGSQLFCRYYDWDCLPDFLPIFYKNPFCAYSMRKICWAIWLPDSNVYGYFDKENPGGTA